VDEFGSDSWPELTRKVTTDEVAALDVRELKRAGLIGSGQESVEGVAHLSWTPCNFGGSRPWFVCPGAGCGRRVAILYRVGPEQPLCRHCCDLAYQSQMVGETGRAELRVEKAEARLPPSGTRPKGMHHTTYLKLTRAYVEALEEQEAVHQERLARLAWRRAARRLRSLKYLKRRRNL
jgi:hypothetical protein